jgi:hypothetical protein
MSRPAAAAAGALSALTRNSSDGARISALARDLLRLERMRPRRLAHTGSRFRRLAALALWALTLGACPAEPCEAPTRQVILKGAEVDPHLGTFRGPLLWLQTGQETELVVQATTEETAVEMSCQPPSVEVQYRIESGDGVVELGLTNHLLADIDGWLDFQGIDAAADAHAVIDAGKLPEAPGVGERQPAARLNVMVESDGTWSVVLAVSTSGDYLNAAAASLRRDPSP